MKTIKKILAITLFLGLLLLVAPTVKSYNLVPYRDTNGNYLTYTGTSTNVMLPDAYEQQDTYFRGIWVTPKDSSCIGTIKREGGKTLAEEIDEYKAEVIQIFDVMNYYNLNALIFHIRIDNDALYPSTMNPWSDWFTTYGLDPGWDPLAWVIEECHKRGYEFHAWMNPYRIKASSDKTVAELATMIRSYAPNNIGADASNILGEKDGGAILNPGIPAVRKFIVDTCMEVIRNYDVDAIHFDDYFYSDMGAAGALTGSNSILTEPDQATYLKYKPDNYSADSGIDKANWRREQVDLFIEELHRTMKMYNESTGRHVQLGISPSGVWRSGDGKVTYDVNGNAITSGSNTRTTFEHYGSYLFSDTLKWVNEEWIDYILPQMYWGFTHTTAAFADLCDWWAKVVKNKKVILYSGMGIYMSETQGMNYSWGKDYKEAYNQILYSTRLKAVQGTVFYNYTYLKNSYLGDQASLYGRGMKLIKEEMFTNPAILPEIISMPAIKLPDVSHLEVVKTDEGNKITFDAVDDAKSYVLYRGETAMDFSTEQVFKLLGSNATAGKIEFIDTNVEDKPYVYGVKVMSRTNTLSDGVDFGMQEFTVTFLDEGGKLLTTVKVPYGNAAVGPTAPAKQGASFIGWSRDISAVKSDLTVSAKYSDSQFNVTFYGLDNKVLKVDSVNFHESATAPNPDQEGYTFIGWSTSFTDVIYDLDVYGIYEINLYKVIFNDENGTKITEIEVEYLQDAVAPAVPKKTGYNFIGWDKDITAVKEDLIVTAVYEIQKFTITFINEVDGSTIKVSEVDYGTLPVLPEAPVVRGHTFKGWIPQVTKVYSDRSFTADYSRDQYQVTFVDWDDSIIEELTIVYEEEVIAPANPSRPYHDFVGWDQEFDDVAEDMTIKAVYKPYTYIVKFFGPNNELLHEEEVNHGESALGFDGQVEGYKFISWDTDYTEVTEDLNIYGTFEEVKTGCNSLSIIYVLGLLSTSLVIFFFRKRLII